MIKIVLLTALTSLSLTGLVTANPAMAEPNRAYNQQTQHVDGQRFNRGREHNRHDTRRERREHRNEHFYGGGVQYSSWNRHNRRGHSNFRRGHGNNVALGIGLGLLTYQIARSAGPRHQHHYVQQYNQPTPPSRVVYVERPQAQTTCLQEREYQTVVIIGGQERSAYGTACLQPDGSWMQGPAMIEPVFR